MNNYYLEHGEASVSRPRAVALHPIIPQSFLLEIHSGCARTSPDGRKRSSEIFADAQLWIFTNSLLFLVDANFYSP